MYKRLISFGVSISAIFYARGNVHVWVGKTIPRLTGLYINILYTIDVCKYGETYTQNTLQPRFNRFARTIYVYLWPYRYNALNYYVFSFVSLAPQQTLTLNSHNRFTVSTVIRMRIYTVFKSNYSRLLRLNAYFFSPRYTYRHNLCTKYVDVHNIYTAVGLCLIIVVYPYNVYILDIRPKYARQNKFLIF